jgi:hypothetical protein
MYFLFLCNKSYFFHVISFECKAIICLAFEPGVKVIVVIIDYDSGYSGSNRLGV